MLVMLPGSIGSTVLVFLAVLGCAEAISREPALKLGNDGLLDGGRMGDNASGFLLPYTVCCGEKWKVLFVPTRPESGLAMHRWS